MKPHTLLQCNRSDRFGGHQCGIALMMALIALVAMSLTAMALIRSVDTGNVIAGNVAFRQASVQAVDVGVEAAYSALQSIVSGSEGTNTPSGCTTGCSYYSTMQAVDINDTPSGVNWSAVPIAATVNGAYQVKYVIDRLCSVATVTDPPAQCYVTKLDPRCTPNVAGGPILCGVPQAVYYRATIRITGPRNTLSFAQATLLRY